MGFPTPFPQLKPKLIALEPPVGGYPRSRRLMRLRCALNSENVPPMTVSITGATGFIGRRLVQKLLSDDHKVFVLTRSATKAASVFPASTYPGVTIAEQGDWEACVRGSTAVVNLAGMPISTRWSPEIKQEIKRSRVNVTSKVVKYINHAGNADAQPSVFVSATAIGYYGSSEIHSFDESSPSGNDYLAEVCREWEATARQVNQQDVRLVLLRIGVVLGKDGGALGRFSWIHLDDLVNLIYESLINPAYKGVINGTAPNPVRLSELCERLGQVVGRPSWLPVPEFALKAVLGEGASVGSQAAPFSPVPIPFQRMAEWSELPLRRKLLDVCFPRPNPWQQSGSREQGRDGIVAPVAGQWSAAAPGPRAPLA
ncbi:hypothetical protein C2845_PM12G32010 [Panicum miliaceum]|uniref:NAD-dependent epimerase/dehydratase domain-containing protein n=1 Tax=Panicum miliaceum TaxID=4540 RepID=A0A3L6QGI5_PANMI|nr:hypothetical protein C2845_PM12G32010 [Panicum miliaceum]